MDRQRFVNLLAAIAAITVFGFTFGLDADDQPVGLAPCALARKDRVRHPAELDDDLGGAFGQALAGAQVEGHAGPAPVVDVEGGGGVGIGLGLRMDAVFFAEAFVLAGDGEARDVFGLHDADGAQELRALIADGVGFEHGRGLHRDQWDRLPNAGLGYRQA